MAMESRLFDPWFIPLKKDNVLLTHSADVPLRV